MNKRQKKKLEKKLQNKMEEKTKLTNKDKDIKKEKDEKLKVKKELLDDPMRFKKLENIHVHFISNLLEKGYGNETIIDEFKKNFGVKINSNRISQIRRGIYYREISRNYRFAKEGYPTFNEYKKIIRNDFKTKIPMQLDFDKELLGISKVEEEVPKIQIPRKNFKEEKSVEIKTSTNEKKKNSSINMSDQGISTTPINEKLKQNSETDKEGNIYKDKNQYKYPSVKPKSKRGLIGKVLDKVVKFL